MMKTLEMKKYCFEGMLPSYAWIILQNVEGNTGTVRPSVPANQP